MATTATETLKVVLPVCPVPECRRVGKIPIGQSHKKVRMQKRTFELVEEGEK